MTALKVALLHNVHTVALWLGQGRIHKNGRGFTLANFRGMIGGI